MNIQEEIKISEHQATKFCKGTDLAELYSAMVSRWKLDSKDVFAASLFYNLGRVHGIREERARRKGGATHG